MTQEEIEKILKTNAQKQDAVYKKIGEVLEGLYVRVTLLETLFYDQTKREMREHDDD